MTVLDERCQTCQSLLHDLSRKMDRLSDAHTLPYNTAEMHTLHEALMALHGVLAGADAVLSLEIKRWGL